MAAVRVPCGTMEGLLVLLCCVSGALGQESIDVSLHWSIWFQILIGMIICFTFLIAFIIVVNTLGWLTTKSRSVALNGQRVPYTYAVPMNSPRAQQPFNASHAQHMGYDDPK